MGLWQAVKRNGLHSPDSLAGMAASTASLTAAVRSAVSHFHRDPELIWINSRYSLARWREGER